MNIETLTDEILTQVIPQARLTDEDRAVIAEHRDFLNGIGGQLVAGFFDIAYGYGPTRAVFSEDELEKPTDFVVDWWTRTVNGPLDDTYFRWMTLVGLVHIRRGVKNPFMISMFAIVSDLVYDLALEHLERDEADRLRKAFSHYGATVSSLITESYTTSYIYALEDLAGLDPKLVGRMIKITVGKLEDEGRAAL